MMRKTNAMMRLSGAAAVLAALTARSESPEKPNILMILADDLGWSDLGCQGSTFYQTPNIDKLASEGMRFTDAYAYSCCSPTRAAIMTGKSPVRLHLTNPLSEHNPEPKSPRERGKDWPWNKFIEPIQVAGLPQEEVTVAERLKAAGYDTAIIGKWHLGGEGFEPEKQGFDVCIGAGYYPHPRTYFSPYKMQDVIQDGPEGEYLTDRLTDETIKFIQTPRTKPFFIYLAHYAVHTPIQAKPEITARYEKRMDPSNPQNNAEYAAMIDSLDQSVGRILESLKASGQEQNTVIIFVSDNGGVIHTFGGNEKVTSNLPLRSGKGTLWEGGIRVPMIVYWPGIIAPGSLCSIPVTCEDFYPTFCELAGVPVETGDATDLDGESFISVLKNPVADLKRNSLCWLYPHNNEFTDACASIRKGNMKLLRFYGGPVELFDLKNDIAESNNLAEQYPELVSGMSAILDTWLKRVNAWEMIPNPNYNPEMHPPGIYEQFDPVKDRANLITGWEFEKSVEGWRILKKCQLTARDGRLIVDSSGYFASMETDASLITPGTYVLQMKARECGIKKGASVLFWKNDQQQYSSRQRVQFALPHDNEEHIVSALFRISGPVSTLRLDPAMVEGTVEYDWIRLYKTALP